MSKREGGLLADVRVHVLQRDDQRFHRFGSRNLAECERGLFAHVGLRILQLRRSAESTGLFPNLAQRERGLLHGRHRRMSAQGQRQRVNRARHAQLPERENDLLAHDAHFNP